MQTFELINYDIVHKIKLGNSTAFGLLFKLYCKPLCNYARVFVRKQEIAEEIVQDTFIKVWEKRELLDEKLSIKAYLFRIVHNNCINFIKKDKANFKNTPVYIEDLKERMHLLEFDVADSYFDALASSEMEHSIYNAISNLPEQCKEVFILSRFRDMTARQIANKLGISINTVKTQLSRALQKIKEKVKNI